jgi:hypothetical protein
MWDATLVLFWVGEVYRCQICNVLLISGYDLDCTLPSDHPARELARYLFIYGKGLSRSDAVFLSTFSSPGAQPRSRVTTTYCEGFEALVGSLKESLFVQALEIMSIIRYPLSFQECEIVTFTWVALWARRIFISGLIQYFELDAGLYEIRTYADIIPFTIIANSGIPLGLAITPTEKEESYRLFDEALQSLNIGPGLVERRPILNDQGSALNAYCKGYLSITHVSLSGVGMATNVALLAAFCAVSF